MATVLQILNANRSLSLFCKGVKGSELEKKLGEIGPFTILGPVNLALQNLQSLTYDQLLEPANKVRLFELLSGYVISGKKMLHDFRNEQKLSTLNGRQITVSVKNGDTHIDGAKILAHNWQGSNGVIHLLDKTFAAPTVEK